MKQILAATMLYLVTALTSVGVLAGPFSSLYVFGDSLSDGGNNPSAVMSIFKLLGNNCDPGHPCPPYVNGHYTNGSVAVEYLAESVLPRGANPTNFFNFAVSGATTGIGNFGDGGTATTPGLFDLPGMQQQLGLYLSMSGGTADPNALYFVWGGANDFLTLDSPIDAAENVAGHVQTLLLAGAEHILVPNLPNIGLTPFANIAGVATESQFFSAVFNASLESLLNDLIVSFQSANIVQFDTFSFFEDVVNYPNSFGFLNAQDGCLLVACTVPENFVYWDDFHPTTQAHSVLAAAFANAIPLPGTIFLFAIGLLVLVGFSRKNVA